MYLLWDWCFMCSRGNGRFTSLPGSPCSSPITGHQSYYLSPPHSSHMGMSQSGYNLNEYTYNTRPNTLFTLDPSRDSSLLKVQTHLGSPRRTLWLNFSWKKEKYLPHIPRCNFSHCIKVGKHWGFLMEILEVYSEERLSYSCISIWKKGTWLILVG